MERLIPQVAGVAVAVALASAAGAQPAPGGEAPPTSSFRVMAATFSVKDAERALDFYTKGLGLAAGPRNEAPAYVEQPILFPDGGAFILLIARKGQDPAVAPRAGRVILAVPDVGALEARLKAAGYALEGPVMDVARFHVRVGMARDPDGNELELVQRTR